MRASMPAGNFGRCGIEESDFRFHTEYTESTESTESTEYDEVNPPTTFPCSWERQRPRWLSTRPCDLWFAELILSRGARVLEGWPCAL
jgi:hypothetical protein